MRMPRDMTARGDGEQGFSLIEVVVAIGILAGVLLSICSMFILGGRQLKTGKTMTEATAIAHDIMETFDKLSFTSLYTTFGATTSTTSVTAVSTGMSNPVTPWNAEITRKLEGGSATVTLLPIGGGHFGAPPGIQMSGTGKRTGASRAPGVSV